MSFLSRFYNLKTVLLRAVYLVPYDLQEDPFWKQKLTTALQRCADFHYHELEGRSVLKWDLVPSVLEGQGTYHWYEQDFFNRTTREALKKVGYPKADNDEFVALGVFVHGEQIGGGGCAALPLRDGKGYFVISGEVIEFLPVSWPENQKEPAEVPYPLDSRITLPRDWATSVVYHEMAHLFGLEHPEDDNDQSVMLHGQFMGLDSTFINDQQKTYLLSKC